MAPLFTVTLMDLGGFARSLPERLSRERVQGKRMSAGPVPQRFQDCPDKIGETIIMCGALVENVKGWAHRPAR